MSPHLLGWSLPSRWLCPFGTTQGNHWILQWFMPTCFHGFWGFETALYTLLQSSRCLYKLTARRKIGSTKESCYPELHVQFWEFLVSSIRKQRLLWWVVVTNPKASIDKSAKGVLPVFYRLEQRSKSLPFILWLCHFNVGPSPQVTKADMKKLGGHMWPLSCCSLQGSRASNAP